jgi:hypothetical protein
MTGHTHLIIKSSRTLKSDPAKDKPYYKIADITPIGLPSTYLHKWAPFTYETTRIDHPTANIIEPFTVKVESEDLPNSFVCVADWTPYPGAAQQKLGEVVNAVAEEMKCGPGVGRVKTQWLFDAGRGFLGAVVKGVRSCVWVDIVPVEVTPAVNYGVGVFDISPAGVFRHEDESIGQAGSERSMGGDGV